MPGRSRITTPCSAQPLRRRGRVAVVAEGDERRLARRGDHLDRAGEPRPRAVRLLARPLEPPLRRRVERCLEAGDLARPDPARVETRRAGLRAERRVVVVDDRETRWARPPGAAPDRRRTARRCPPARRATSGPRPCRSRTRSRRPGSRRPTARRRRGSASPVSAFSSATGSTFPVDQATCESAIRRVPGVIAARIASSASSAGRSRMQRDADRRARRRERPEQAGMLDVGGDDVVVRPEAEPAEHDVAAVRGRAGRAPAARAPRRASRRVARAAARVPPSASPSRRRRSGPARPRAGAGGRAPRRSSGRAARRCRRSGTRGARARGTGRGLPRRSCREL